MDQPSRIFCALGILWLCSAAFAQDALPPRASTPPRSGVGAVSLQDPMEDSSLQATAERLAERIESAGSERVVPSAEATPAEGASTPAERKPRAPLPAPRPGASTGEPTAASGERTSISDRFGRGLGGVIGRPQEADKAWWQTPEVRVFGFLGVLGVAAIVIRRMSRKGTLPGAGRPSGVISVLARYPFGRGASLVLLECGPRIILLHQHGGRGGEVTSIAEFTDPEEIARLRARMGATERESEGGFQDSLLKNLGRYDRKGRPQGFGQGGGLPIDDVMETVDLTRRRPRRGGLGD